MKTTAMTILDDLNKPYSPELKKAISQIVDGFAKQTNEKLAWDAAINKYLGAIKADYFNWGNLDKMSEKERAESVQGKMAKEFEKGVSIEEVKNT